MPRGVRHPAGRGDRRGVLLIILIPLAITSERLIVTSKISECTAEVTRELVQASGYRLLSVDAETADGSVPVLIAGRGALPPVERFECQAQEILLNRRLVVKVLASDSFSVGTGQP